jgi:hypothetical protein
MPDDRCAGAAARHAAVRRAALPVALVTAAALLTGCSTGASHADGEPSPSPASAAASPSVPFTTPSATPSPKRSPSPPALIAFAGCDNPRALPGRGAAPYDGLTLRLKAPVTKPAATLRTGHSFTAHAVIANTTKTARTFDVTGNPVQATLLDAAGHGSLLAWNDTVMVTHVTLAPRSVRTIPVAVYTRSCAPHRPDPPLPPGTYKLGFALGWLAGTRHGTWGVKPLTVKVVR